MSRLLAIGFLMVLLSTALMAQTITGTMTGTVLDPPAQRLPEPM